VIDICPPAAALVDISLKWSDDGDICNWGGAGWRMVTLTGIFTGAPTLGVAVIWPE